MKQFNLTEWSLNHRQLVWFFIIMSAVAGAYSYKNMGRMEDPDFTIRKMVVAVGWPGASAEKMEQQVTDKIEKRLQDTPGLNYLESFSRPQQSVIFVNLKETVKDSEIRPTWLEVRNMVNDIRSSLPEGIVGPFFNDRFDDVYGNIYALTSDGFTYEEMRVEAEKIRQILLEINTVKKVELIGVQPEKIYIEMENEKLAKLGIDPMLIVAIIKGQNTMTPSGMLDTATDNIFFRVTGIFDDIDALKALPIRVIGRTFRLGDIASISRAYADPPEPKMYYDGRPAIGIAVSMETGGNVITLGKELDRTFDHIRKDLPLGLSIDQVANQPEVVKNSIDEFVKTLAEAIAIILLVSFLSLGLRSGMVVAMCIPLVVAATFVVMKMAGIDLHKVSLGSLIISLGLLVDDAIIAVEMMAVKLEQGWEKMRAAAFAYSVTAFPMLTGTLITCSGFIPIGFADGDASEFCKSIFPVITISLLISWVVSVMVTPMFGFYLIKVKPVGERKGHDDAGLEGLRHEDPEHKNSGYEVPKNGGSMHQYSGHQNAGHEDIYDRAFYRAFRKVLVWCLTHRMIILFLTIAAFVLSIHSFRLVKQEFFPGSIRPELVVKLTLPEGASLEATNREAMAFSDAIKNNPDIDHYSFYVGTGAPRFILTFDPLQPASNIAQFVIVAKGLDQRKKLEKDLSNLLASSFPAIRGHVKTLDLGPPEPYPVMLRVSGYEYEKVRSIAAEVQEAMTKDPDLKDVNFNWYEKTKKIQLEIDQDKARMLGVNSSNLALNIQSQISGIPVSEFREDDRTIEIKLRLDAEDRRDLSDIRELSIPVGQGRNIPLEQIAKISFGAEEGMIWRRNLKPTITVQADTVDGVTGNDATAAVYSTLKSVRENLPSGYEISLGGVAEQSNNSTGYIMAMVPVMVMIIMTLLMFQLQNISGMVLTILSAPLGINGVIASLLISGMPMGFLAQLGILALSGIIIRNSVILMDQIDRQIEAGETRYHAIINAAVLRFRPIMLTAAAAILGMLPLVLDRFWGPMAVSIAGGLFGATILTLFVLPCMYAAWYRVRSDAA